MKHSWFSRHPICFMALYLLFYLSAFNFLETRISMPHLVLVHCRLDDLIPFCKYAVIPYFAWFVWIPFTLFYLLLRAPREDFWRLCMPLFSGMTIFLIICTVFPNGLNLRPEVFTHDNFCIELVKRIYQTDTPTNVLPSLHVYNSICCYIAISHCEKLQHSRLIQKGSLVLSILIILSTMFLKQHSVVDVVAACVMAYFMYSLIYAQEGAKSPRLARHVI